VLRESRRHFSGRLHCVFGCGGNRDAGKRPLMGGIAARFADSVIVTDDNPRNESPQKIVADILAGCPGDARPVKVIHDRVQAIKEAIAAAKPGDVVLVAGKGHETYQEIAGEKKPLLTNRVISDPRISDQDWAVREGMVAFAGYPLLIEDRVLGVLAMFSRRPLAEDVLTTLGAIADSVASVINQKYSTTLPVPVCATVTCPN
jgi:GAF domain-containing protein